MAKIYVRILLLSNWRRHPWLVGDSSTYIGSCTKRRKKREKCEIARERERNVSLGDSTRFNRACAQFHCKTCLLRNTLRIAIGGTIKVKKKPFFTVQSSLPNIIEEWPAASSHASKGCYTHACMHLWPSIIILLALALLTSWLSLSPFESSWLKGRQRWSSLFFSVRSFINYFSRRGDQRARQRTSEFVSRCCWCCCCLYTYIIKCAHVMCMQTIPSETGSASNSQKYDSMP